MKALLNVIKYTICSMIIFIPLDFFYSNPTYNGEYIFKLLFVMSGYSIVWAIYFTLRGE